MDLAYFLGRAWDFIVWFANMVISTVATSIFGGWNAVIILAIIAAILFLITRTFIRRSDD
jgi:hypothetical protein